MNGSYEVMSCNHETKIKYGKQRYRSGVFQKYQCQKCGAILKGEFLKPNEIHEPVGIVQAGVGVKKE